MVTVFGRFVELSRFLHKTMTRRIEYVNRVILATNNSYVDQPVFGGCRLSCPMKLMGGD